VEVARVKNSPHALLFADTVNGASRLTFAALVIDGL
jgi:hypothetical protein